MAVIASCPNCNAEFDATGYDLGDQFQCPDCGTIVTVTRPQSQSGRKLTIGDRSRIGSGIKKKTGNQRSAKPRTSQMRKDSGSRRPSGTRSGSVSRARTQRASMRQRDEEYAEDEYFVAPQSNSKKMILIFSGLAVVAIVLVIVLVMLNSPEKTETPNPEKTTEETKAVNNDDGKSETDETSETNKDIVDKPEEKTQEEIKKEVPVTPVKITRSEEYVKLINGYFKEVVEAKVNDLEYMENVNKLAQSKIKSEIDKILQIYESKPAEKCPEDYFFGGLLDMIKEKSVANYTECIELVKTGISWKYNDMTYYAYYKRGIEYRRFRDSADKVIADLTVVIEKEPTFAPAYYYRAKSYFVQGKYNESYWDILNAEEYDEEYSKYRDLMEMKNKCWNKGARQKMSLEDLNKQIEENPESVKAFYARGSYYFSKKEYVKAEADFSKIFKIVESNNQRLSPQDEKEIKRLRIICWREMGQLEKALEEVDKLINKYSSDAILYATRGLIYLKMKKYRDALVDLEYAKSIDIDGKLKTTDQIDKAIKECKEALGQ